MVIVPNAGIHYGFASVKRKLQPPERNQRTMMKSSKPQGPNVKKLIIQKMSTDAIPADGGLADGLKFLSDPEAIIAGARKATEFVELAIKTVRESAEPNPWKNASDEDIAGEILRQIGVRRGEKQS